MGTANTCWHLEIWAGVFTFFIRQLSQFPTLFGCSTISKCNFYFSIYLINLINWQMLNRFPLINATNFSWLNNKWINIFCLVISLKPIFFCYILHPSNPIFSWPKHSTSGIAVLDLRSTILTTMIWCRRSKSFTRGVRSELKVIKLVTVIVDRKRSKPRIYLNYSYLPIFYLENISHCWTYCTRWPIHCGRLVL